MRRSKASFLVLALVAASIVASDAACPFAAGARRNLAAVDSALDAEVLETAQALKQYDAKAAASLDVAAVKADLVKLMTDSQPFWPADDGNYGPLFIRLAWHSAGSYRSWDGRGGVNGARQRFNPELSWDDNTNLDKARKLLAPIKAKYGAKLSFADLIALAGEVAIESMGGPSIGFCGGRIDDVDGVKSLPLGPTKEQEAIAPCKTGDGMCEQPLGQTTMGLIYVNPEGPMGKPEPEKSAPQIRGTFGRMGMNDSETVALIGAHAFGKTHGACPTGAGPNPTQSPKDPWPGTCGSGPMKGKGPNTFTSGFEGHWTTTPNSWSNQYFQNLLGYEWEKHKGPGGHWQWKPVKLTAAATPRQKASPLPKIMMLTSDIALLHDPEYLKLVKLYASDIDALTKAFGNAWYKLMTRDMGPASRCLGKDVPKIHNKLVAFELDNQATAAASSRPDYGKVRADISRLLTEQSTVATPDTVGGKAYYGGMLATLAWQCASTFRATDKQGGCNGARIRFSPQKDWETNKGLDRVMQLLEPIKAKYPSLSWADLIVLAGTTANEQAAAAKAGSLNFCGGRGDAASGTGTEHLAPRTYPKLETAVTDSWAVAGLTAAQGVALAARLRSPELQKLQGYSGSYSSSPDKLSNEYFKVLLGNEWVEQKSAAGKTEFVAKGKPGVSMVPSDLVIKNDPALAAIAKGYAADNAKFLSVFKAAWQKMMNADRFSGPAGNLCDSGVAV